MIDRTRQKQWDSEHYASVSCRLSRNTALELRRKLSEFYLTRYTFLRICCEWVVEGKLDSLLLAISKQVRSAGEQDEELNAIVRGLDSPHPGD